MADTPAGLKALLDAASQGRIPTADEALAGLLDVPAATLMPTAEALTLAGFGAAVTYSRKVFIPLTRLCRDVCSYCTFAKAPRKLASAYLSPEEVLAIARAGQAADCKEALFTLGDKPEERYSAARAALKSADSTSTLEYLQRMAKLVLEETGLLPHLNPGVLEAADFARLRPVSVSMGLMLESASERLCQRGGPHFGSPDKLPCPPARNPAGGRRGTRPHDDGSAHRHRGNPPRAHRVTVGVARAAHPVPEHIQELIIQNFKGRSREPGWPTPPNPPWKNSSGPLPSPGCCSEPGCRSRHRPTCNPAGSPN